MSDVGTAAESVVRLGNLHLVVVKGSSAGERFETAVPGQPVTIGRKATNDFVLKDETVSREHAVIQPGPDGWRISARKREALLMHAGKVVPEEGALLADGDEITLGTAVVKVTIEPLVEDEDVDRTVVIAPDIAPPPPPAPEPPPAPAIAPEPVAMPAARAPEPPPPPAPAPREPAWRRAGPRDRVGRFDVFAPLYDSDASRIERAVDSGSGRAVLLRRPGGPALGFFARRRFRQAVDRLRGITAANVLAPIEAGRAGAETFTVHPAVEGVSAAVVLREGRRDLPIDLAVWIALEAARGVAHVEETAGPFVRLAVGEGEVICGRDGAVHVLLAPATPVPPSADRYGAPEEHGGSADLRASMFSIGVLLWELLAREPVLPGQQSTLRSVDAVRIQVPPSLAAVTMRALEVRPEDRFARVADLTDALDDELRRVAPAYTAEAAARWLREHVPDEEGDSR
jgi:pSer/pThr/pTyr-binding forkhead associated (FHA) protein